MFINPFRKKDLDRRRRSSNMFQKKEDSSKVINTRLQITIVVICILFGAITVRLVQLQLFDNAVYSLKLDEFTAKKQTFSAARGDIYDRNGKLLANSVSSLTVAYYPPENISDKEEWQLAKKVVDEIGITDPKIDERQTKDMYILYRYDMGEDDRNFNSLLKEKELEKANRGELSVDELHELKVQRVDITGVDEYLQKILYVKMLMDQEPANQYKAIIEDATQEQISYLSEHNSDFEGFITRSSDWKREYPGGEVVKGVLGSVSTQTQGIPSELKYYYSGLGYAMNERVGISGLEKQYEQLLSGTKISYKIDYDKNGLAVLNTLNEGKSGYDLTLTLDMDLQNKVDEVLKKHLENAKSDSMRQYFNNVYLVAVEPKTGEILSMNGASKSTEGEVFSKPTGTYLEADRVGSSIKVATLYMGLDQGVVKPGEIINDAPMQIKGTDPIQSYKNYGSVSDVRAIEISSNVYMWHIALRLAGNNYTPNAGISVKDGTFELMRTYYNMFGLGVPTGLDLPDEAIGVVGGTETEKIIPFPIGQYDTYTTMQLAQYAATIASDGYRPELHLLKNATEVNDRDTVVYEKGVSILSVLKGNRELLKRGQEGMRACVTSGFCSLKTESGKKMASKTGTAENELYIDGQRIEVTNATQIAYGPYEDPKIAFACFAPQSNNGFGTELRGNVCSEIIDEVTEYYFSK